MRKLTFIIFMLIGALAFSQGGPKVNTIKFIGNVTTTIRDSWDVPVGEDWLIYNTTTGNLEVGDSNEVWTTVGSGAQISGTPVNNELAVWTNLNTIEGEPNVTWDGFILDVTGSVSISSILGVDGSIQPGADNTGSVGTTTGTWANIRGQNVTAENGFLGVPTDTEPAAVEGAFYSDDSEDRPKYYDGISWKKFLLDGDAAGGGGSSGVNVLTTTETADATHAVSYNITGATIGTYTVTLPLDSTYDHPVGTALVYVGDPTLDATISVTKEVGVTAFEASTTRDQQVLIYHKTGANAWSVEVLESGVNSSISGRTGTPVTGIQIETESQLGTNGTPPTGKLVFCSDCAPAETETTATISMDGYYFHDDRSNDAATITFNTLKKGGVVKIWYNRASEPAYSGATMKQLPNTTAFAAATELVGVYEVNFDGEIDYYFYEVTP